MLAGIQGADSDARIGDQDATWVDRKRHGAGGRGKGRLDRPGTTVTPLGEQNSLNVKALIQWGTKDKE